MKRHVREKVFCKGGKQWSGHGIFLATRKAKILRRAANASLSEDWNWQRGAISVDSDGVELRFPAAKYNARIFALVKERGDVSCTHLMLRCVVLGHFWISRSGSLFSVVIPQHPAQSFAACRFTGGTAHFIARLYQLVVESLMVSLLMIMSKEICRSILQ
jgi:hypothetical protein